MDTGGWVMSIAAVVMMIYIVKMNRDFAKAEQARKEEMEKQHDLAMAAWPISILNPDSPNFDPVAYAAYQAEQAALEEANA